jgi:hypothetical protein
VAGLSRDSGDPARAIPSTLLVFGDWFAAETLLRKVN